ncbi:MAG: c-type cytochrome [Bdellovibrionota bacterium]
MLKNTSIIKKTILIVLTVLILGSSAVHLLDPDFAGVFTRETASNSLESQGSKLYINYQCISCHGKNGDNPILKDYPIIARQNTEYLFNQMMHIRDGVRTNGGSSYMKEAMGKPSNDELRAIATYLNNI